MGDFTQPGWTDFQPTTLETIRRTLVRKPYMGHADAFIQEARAALLLCPALHIKQINLIEKAQDAAKLAVSASQLLKRIKHVQRTESLESSINAQLWNRLAPKRLDKITQDIEALEMAARNVASGFDVVRQEKHPKLKEKALVASLAAAWRKTFGKEPKFGRDSTFHSLCALIGKNDFELEIGPETMKAAKTPS